MKISEERIFSNGEKYTVECYDYDDESFINSEIDEYSGEKRYDLMRVFPRSAEIDIYELSDGRILKNGRRPEIYLNDVIFCTVLLESKRIFKSKIVKSNFPIPHIVYTLSKKRVVFQEIDRTIALSFISLANEVNAIRAGEKPFVTPQGDAIVKDISEKRFYRYRSLEEYRVVVNNQTSIYKLLKENTSEINEDLIGLNHLKYEFTSNIDFLIESIPKVVGCPMDILDFSENSLDDLTYYLYSNEMSWVVLDNLYLPLVAYIGETYIRNYDASWGFVQSKLFDEIFPDIFVSSSRKYIHDFVYRVLSPDWHNWVSLRTFLQ